MQRKNRLAVFEHIAPKESPSGQQSKRPRSPEYDIIITQSNIKRRRKNIITTKEDLSFACECNECSFTCKDYYGLLNHLEKHLIDVIDCIQGEISYNCFWANCDNTYDNFATFRHHFLYHAYNSKLQLIALDMLHKLKLPECKEPLVKLPVLPNYYLCEWDSCGRITQTYQDFLDHVRCHVNATPKRADSQNPIKCEWAGCSGVFPVQYKLTDHCRSHTKEKIIACPTCGVMFSARTKFYDHRKRQLPTELQGYQCSQCSKLFASERLLRDHMRVHINHYKCHLCDMTCPKPSSLAKHIRYRHLPERLFKCDICGHSTITQQDLERHLATHETDNKFKCPDPDCDFICRSKFTYTKHLKKHEGTWEKTYACHCCEKRFSRGAFLTRHLIRVHDFHWPSGHSRFSYKQDAKSGLYHLQVVRYESLEVTQEMIEGNIAKQFESGQNCKFECEESANKPFAFVLKVANCTENMEENQAAFKLAKAEIENTKTDDIQNEQNEQNEENEENEENEQHFGDNVVITIEEMDSEGNVIKVEKVESQVLYATELL